MIERIKVKTAKHTSVVNITQRIRDIVEASSVDNGLCIVYVPHTTAAVFINEGADPDVVKDILNTLEKLVPWSNGYAHTEGNAAAHIKSSIIGNSRIIPILEGKLMLGRWEAVFLAEFDGPREREVIVSVARI
ncbi:secondary thiamine-phosphate synthase enzyme YjbQ [Hydrogenobaculum acidophilum]